MWSIYAHTLRRIERARYDVFSRRIGISRPLKAMIALRYWLSRSVKYSWIAQPWATKTAAGRAR